jgi:hypothetical protein
LDEGAEPHGAVQELRASFRKVTACAMAAVDAAVS